MKHCTAFRLLLALLSLSLAGRAEAFEPDPPALRDQTYDSKHGLTRFPIPRLRHFRQLPSTPFTVVVTKKYVIFNTGGSALPLFRMPRPGGPMTQLLPGFNQMISSPVLWRGRIYFKTLRAIWSVAVTGGKPRLELPFPDSLRLFVSGDRLYRTKFRGRVIEELWPEKQHARTVAKLAASPGTLVFDGGYIYTCFYGRGQVLRVDKRGRVKVLARGQRKAVEVAVLGDYIYWSVETGGGEIRRRRKNGRGKIETIARGQINAECFAVHQGALYWRNWSGGRGNHTIQRYDPKSRKVSVAVSGLSAPARMAFDDTYIYVADKNTGTIVRAPKPKALTPGPTR